MDSKLKTRWVEALRSGKYVQGRKMLRGEDGKMCCLGVLCHISNSERFARMGCYDEVNTSLDFQVFVPGRGGMLKETCRELATWNDTGWTFSEIADWIEDNIPTVVDPIVNSG